MRIDIVIAWSLAMWNGTTGQKRVCRHQSSGRIDNFRLTRQFQLALSRPPISSGFKRPIPLLLGGCRIDDRTDSRDSIDRETALPGVLAHCVFIGCNVYTVDFAVRDVALNPLNLHSHLS